MQAWRHGDLAATRTMGGILLRGLRCHDARFGRVLHGHRQLRCVLGGSELMPKIFDRLSTKSAFQTIKQSGKKRDAKPFRYSPKPLKPTKGAVAKATGAMTA